MSSFKPYIDNNGKSLGGGVPVEKSEDENPLKVIDPVKQGLGSMAANEIIEGQRVGLGTGTTATEFIKCLAKRCEDGLKITAVASSEESYKLAKELGINVLKLNEIEITDDFFLDVYVDGADEVDENFNMIKGRGGALHREKVLASSSKKVIIMIDRSKQVNLLGIADLPIEATIFGCNLAKKKLEELGYFSEKRKSADGSFYITDNGNYILDVTLPKLLKNPKEAHKTFKNIIGVVEIGIFIGLVDQLMIGDAEGNFEIIDAKTDLKLKDCSV